MKIINWLINKYATGGLMIVSALFSILGLILLLATIFNFPPYIIIKKGASESTFGLIDFKNGIPVIMKSISAEIPDTSIIYGGNIRRIYPGRKPSVLKNPNLTDSLINSDTIITSYNIYPDQTKKISVSINGSKLDKIKVFLKTESLYPKLLFVLPLILFLFLLAVCSRFLALLLQSIQDGNFFVKENYNRLLKIGWSIILYQLVVFIFYFLQRKYLETVSIDFISSDSNYRQPLQLSFVPSMHANFDWLLGGCVFLIVAKAFQRGYKLQEEQALTI